MEGMRVGLCKCILGGRPDLCIGADFNGKDKDAPWKDYGPSGVRRRCARCASDL